MSHHPRKRFGQNFLQDPQVISEILDAVHPQPSDHFIEIGPGLGALTKPLLRILPKLTAIEIDRDLHAQLISLPKLQLLNADALSVDYRQFGEGLRIIGNLPYNISTPLILHLLTFSQKIVDMHFMLQKEVVERLASAPGCKAYGRLSVVVQYWCEVEYLFTVPARAFYPEPKVESAIVRLTPYLHSPYPNIDFVALQRVVTQAFSTRRKTLANNLKGWLSANDLIDLGIDPGLRPEQICVTDYVQIAKFIAN